MDFILSAETEDYRKRVRAFVDAEIIPLEGDRATVEVSALPVYVFETIE